MPSSTSLASTLQEIPFLTFRLKREVSQLPNDTKLFSSHAYGRTCSEMSAPVPHAHSPN
jgi:hypothetical protein